MQPKPDKRRASLIGGAVIGILTGIPGLNVVAVCCCCAGLMAGGAVAYYVYRNEHQPEMEPLESTDGIILGIFSGLIGAVAGTVLSVFLGFVFGHPDAKLMLRIFDWLESKGNLPPASADQIDQLREEFQRQIEHGPTLGKIAQGLFFALILDPIFSMLGGLIGYGLFGKKKYAEQSPPQP